LYFPIVAIISSVGITPASLSLLAFTIIMKRMAFSSQLASELSVSDVPNCIDSHLDDEGRQLNSTKVA
jgi:hypothetical protein